MCQLEGIFRPTVDAVAQIAETGFLEDLEVFLRIALLHAQLADHGDVADAAPDDFLAHRTHGFRIAREVAVVEMEEATAIVGEPFDFVGDLDRIATSPVKAFSAEIATRPAAAAREDDRDQLVGVVISVELDIGPLVGRETQCIDIFGQCGGGEPGCREPRPGDSWR